MKRYLILSVLLIAGAILFQGFQCASPEMTTARIAVTNNDWKKVEEFAGKEISKNPRNGEAKFLLSRAKLKLNKIEAAAELILEAEKLPLEIQTKQQIPLTKFYIWTSAYNAGITQFNKYLNGECSTISCGLRGFESLTINIMNLSEVEKILGKGTLSSENNNIKIFEWKCNNGFILCTFTDNILSDKTQSGLNNNSVGLGCLDSAIKNFEIALMVRPENAEFWRLIGRAYEELGNNEKTMEIYKTYISKLKNEIDWAKAANVFLMMPRKDVMAKLGKPGKSVGEMLGEDSVLTDMYSVMGRPIYIYYSLDEHNDFIVEGWRINPPAEWLDNEKQNFTTLNIGPFATLAEYYFNAAVTIRDNPKLDSSKKANGINENLEKSKDYTKTITSLDPTNVDANRFLVNLYEAQGKSEYALDEISKLVQKDPNNKFYLAQYGELFMRLNKYDDAIAQYQKALAIDPNFCDVNRNIAAAYKNKAVIIIQAQEDKKDKDKNYKEQPEEYKPLLVKSTEYFNKSRNCEKYKNDLQVLSELANLYYGLSNLGMNTKNDLNSIVDDLERMEQAIPDDEKEAYWLKMCKILGDMQSPKSTRACQEAQKYIK
ncbi:MAG: tetratricopeptide repeat protein [bacterium]